MADMVPEAGVDFERANAARMYDYLLGGAHNFRVDRETAEAAMVGFPDLRRLAQANRAFLRRVVLWCVEQGIDQFLDLGSGVPTVGNVHEIAPDGRVAYVDFEPVAVAHGREIIEQQGLRHVTMSQADMRLPATVFAVPGVADLIDLDRPVAVLAVAVLHFVDDDLPAIVEQYRRHLAPGSVVAISHSSDEHPDPAITASMRAVRDAYASSATPLILRDRADIDAALRGLTLVAPGLVDIVDWPEAQPDAEPTSVLGAVARTI